MNLSGPKRYEYEELEKYAIEYVESMYNTSFDDYDADIVILNIK